MRSTGARESPGVRRRPGRTWRNERGREERRAVSAVAERPRLQRDPAGGLLGGVCAGLARWLGVQPLALRLALAAAAFVGGLGVVVYALAWAILPAPAGASPVARAVQHRPRLASLQVGAGVTLLLGAALLTLRALGLWAGDQVALPAVLVAGGLALIWRQATLPPAPSAQSPRAADTRPGAPSDADRVLPLPLSGTGRTQSRGGIAPDLAALYRGGFGVALILGAGLLVLQSAGALSGARDLVLSVVVVTLALGLILAPLLFRMGRQLTAERAARIRSQERAEVAAHLHDSVLQTLALVQRQAGDPRAVATLARRQERELRAWLDGPDPASDERLAAALHAAAAEVEERFGAPVEVVAVGDAPLDDATRAIVAAAREAMTNAAKFARDGGPVAVFAEVDEHAVSVFVRDRGAGFDPAAVPGDRRGLRESVLGRMARHGGHASVRAAPGQGTEIELRLPRGGAA